MIKRLLLFVMNTCIYKILVSKLIPKVKFYSKIKGESYNDLKHELRLGDIVVTRSKWALSSRLIKGKWSHALICVNRNGKEDLLAEMIATGGNFTTLYDVCTTSDSVAIIRCYEWDNPYIQRVTKHATWLCMNALYDINFDFNNMIKSPTSDKLIPQLYCSELIYEADIDRRLKLNLEDLAGLGRRYISPNGLYKASNIQIVKEV